MSIRTLLAASLLALAACASPPSNGAPERPLARISHDVFFTFENPTDEECDALVEACRRLEAVPGVVHLVAGRRDETQAREVNEQAYHVGLHVEFEDQAAYDGYGPHPVHMALVDEFVPRMSAVVVYDTRIAPPR
ncbi:MAG: Dabb family protein [Planctomycetota bacterium]